MQSSDFVIVCKGVSKQFSQGDQRVVVLDELDFTVAKGEMVAILGQSGSGKSTLLNLIGGLDSIDHGEISVRDTRVDGCNEDQLALMRNSSLGFVYQFHHLLADFSALENVMMPLLMRKDDSRKSARESAFKLLKAVGLEHRQHHRPEALSGGERQRVAIARALVSHPDCVLMDEPTGNLDEETAQNVLSLLISLKSSLETAFVIVTHDKGLASHMDTVYELRHGKLHKVQLEK